MNRLSAYAERESESESPEERQRSEEQATIKLLEQLQIAKDTKAKEPKETQPASDQANGEHANGAAIGGEHTDGGPTNDEDTNDNKKEETSTKAFEVSKDKADESLTTNEDAEQPTGSKSRGIPDDVKLYEIFYGQVTHLVHAQRLPIQDTIALLVSLANLAL